MKKVLLILLLFPLVVNAACDKDKYQSNIKDANHITYDNNYSESAGLFNITLYAVADNLKVVYNNRTYSISNNTVQINNISQGSNVSIDIFGNDGCDQVRTILIKEPFYNSFYKSDICREYEGVLTACSSQFTQTKVTREYLDKVIENYKDVLVAKEEKEEKPVEKVSFREIIEEYFLNWGVKILLALFTTMISVGIYSRKFEKMKHGI